MDEATVRELWDKTMQARDWAEREPGLTFKPDSKTIAAPLAAPPGDLKSGFELTAELGRGGMGVVYRARQASLERPVALKTVLPSLASPEMRASFIAEALVTGSLAHPNVVPVHELGTLPSGEPFLAMKLVTGRSWKALLAESRDQGRHIEILLSVCDAVAFAHSRGIVHRDLKPENVMVGEFGEVVVMDWGLAIDVNDAPPVRPIAPHRSSISSPAGTPAYMAPELAEGRGADQGPWTDVYLLGAILHEIVTGAPPHRGKRVLETLLSAMRSDPPELPGVPAELAAIVRRAMAKAPAGRFPTVAAFRAALGEYLEHREAHAITRKGEAALERLRAAVATRSPDEPHRHHAEARFAFEHALSIWGGLDEARQGLARADRALLEHALASEDVALATRLVASCPEERPRVEELRRRVEARARELEELRDTARRLDWSELSRPLGEVFMLGGVLGGVCGFATPSLVAQERNLLLMSIWAVAAGTSGLHAWRRLRGTRVPDSLLTMRVIGMWGAVSLACLLVGVTNRLRNLPVFSDTCYSALLLAVGFASMAFQTRRWLLAGSLGWVAAAFVMAASTRNGALHVFAAAWIATIGGTGVALRLGAPLAPR